MMTRIGLLLTWIQEEQTKLENLLSNEDFPHPDPDFREALKLPIWIHRERIKILIQMVEDEHERNLHG